MKTEGSRSLKINMVLNAVKGLMNLAFPLVTFPYISRILGVDDIGRYNFAHSIISYFTLFAGLGINTYAVREGASSKDDPSRIKHFADEMFSIQLIATVLSYVLLIITLTYVPRFYGYLDLLSILSFQMILKTIGIEWIYSIYEDYTYLTVRSILFQFLSLILMFTFVKTEKDVDLYAAITVLSNAGAALLDRIHACRYCRVGWTHDIDWKEHLRPIVLLFAMSITVTIYVSSDITMLGLYCDDRTVGLYSVSTKIYSIVKTILSSIIVVSIPRFSFLIGRRDTDDLCLVAKDIYSTLLTLSIPAITGIILLRKQMILLIAGAEYMEASSSLALLSVALFFCLGAYFWGQCILVPLKHEEIVFRSTLVSAGVNVLLNVLLIPIGKEDVAAFTTIVAEGIAFIWSRHEGRRYVKIEGMEKLILQIGAGCIGILAVSIVLGVFCRDKVIYTVSMIILSALVYFGIQIFLKNEAIGDIAGNAKQKIGSRRSSQIADR